MAKQKKKKRRLKIKSFIILILLIILVYLLYILLNQPITNIYISGNTFYTDQQIIDMVELDTYPKSLDVSKFDIKNILENDLYIKKVNVKRKHFLREIYIDIVENKALFYYSPINKTILSDGSSSDDTFDIPLVINVIPDTKFDSFLNGMNNISTSVFNKISEIKYDPNDVDEDRFLFTMNDGNYVYITLTKFDSINDYIDIIKTVSNKKGILYLDSGEYFDIFDE